MLKNRGKMTEKASQQYLHTSGRHFSSASNKPVPQNLASHLSHISASSDEEDAEIGEVFGQQNE